MNGRPAGIFNGMMFPLAIAVLIGCLSAVWLLGWFSRPKPWEESTGWNRIPEALKPAVSEDHPDRPWIRWLGHSGFVIRWHGSTLLLDPNRSGHCTVSSRFMERPPVLDALGPVSVIVSHAHFDHLNQDTLVELPRLESILLPSGSEVFLDRIDPAVTRIVPVETGRVYEVGNLRVTPVRAAHNGNRFHPLHSKFDARGYMIQGPDGMTIYYAGDTSDDLDWGSLRETFHPDIAILPIGAYSPRIPLKYHHLNPEEAAEAAVQLGVKKVIPCHFGTFTLSLDRPNAALPRFAQAMNGRTLPWEMPRLITPGDLDLIAAESENGQETVKQHHESPKTI